MAFRLPRLRKDTPLVDPKTGLPTITCQQWWQSHVEDTEGAVTAVLAAQADIVQILVDLGLVTQTADGALELAQSAINPGGTIKDEKVITDSIIPDGVTERYLSTAVINIALPDGVETDVVSTTVTKIRNESDIDIDVSLRLQSSDDLRGALRLYRDATLITSFGPYMDSPGATLRNVITMLHTDIGVPAGVYNYRVTFERTGGGSDVEAASGSLMRAKEYKR